MALALAVGAYAWWQYSHSGHKLLPDLVAVPARDIKVERSATSTLLYFSTTYYNAGEGPLELRFDKVAQAEGDTERDVDQRIYMEDGTYVERPVGRYVWEAEHQHFHFEDFVGYSLENIDTGTVYPGDKATFCVRDVSRVEIDLPARSQKGPYVSCARGVQGSSVGWGDTYYYDYPGQTIDISALPSGRYRMYTRVNPDGLFKEITRENNTSYTEFVYDAAVATTSDMTEYPVDIPTIDYTRLNDPFGILPDHHE